MAYKSSSRANDIELQRLNSEDERTAEGKTVKSVNFASDIDINGNKMPKPNKNVQFSSPQVSFENEFEFEVKPNLIPNRKREEETVMDNLRKRVGDLQLDKNFKRKSRVEAEKEEEEPLLKAVREQVTDQDFIVDCLCWHNEYRARHNSPAMSISMKLCVSAQEWANHLASRNELYFCPSRISGFNFGQNIFCCVETSLMLSISGQEVATYWYSSMKRYDYGKKPSLLHTNINSGHFSQIVWKNTKYMGVGKSVSTTGKIFVVGFYYPPGNVINEYHENVLPPAESKQTTRPSSVNSNNKHT